MKFYLPFIALLSVFFFRTASGQAVSVPAERLSCDILLAERLKLSGDMRAAIFSDHTFDAKRNINRYLSQILLEYRMHGSLHVINTGIEDKGELLKLFPDLGFTDDRKFLLGGRASEATQEKWIEKDLLRNLDFYPPHLYLLPNTEVNYQKFSPRDVLFYVETPPTPGSGGRIFLHSAKEIEESVKSQAGGQELLRLVRAHGLMNVTGYVDSRHGNRKANYYKSWQELTGENDIDEAWAQIKSRTGEFTDSWKIEDNDSGSSDGIKTYTLMTSITNPGFNSEDGESYLNVPRIALTQPAFENGFRKFQLGNGQDFTAQQLTILMTAYLNTRKGSESAKGDLYLVDNLRAAHSREAFDVENNPRKILVGMSGVRFVSDVAETEREDIIINYGLSRDRIIPIWERIAGLAIQLPYANGSAAEGGSESPRYRTPPMDSQINEEFSMQRFDMANKDLNDPKVLSKIKSEFEKYGRLHIINNDKNIHDLPESVLERLGFGSDQLFAWGGKTSGRTVRQSLGGGFHTVDKFPAQLPLLAHNEILYQRILPRRLLFNYWEVSGEGNGGRTFVHSAQKYEKLIRSSGDTGIRLLNKLAQFGQMIRTGFLDESHPLKSQNYVRSWQDRFATNDIDQAVLNCLAQRTHFDRCWKQKLGEKNEVGGDTFMLMTEITIPMFKVDIEDGHRYMMFPRIAYDGPSIINGFREFIIGNGEAFSRDEMETMLQASWLTREGIYQKPGDILLVDNLKYGHSREPYKALDENGISIPRRAGVIMSGTFYTDDY
jgi:hypothetical protein